MARSAPRLAQPLPVARLGGRGDDDFGLLGQLHGVAADCARGSVDQDRLPRR